MRGLQPAIILASGSVYRQQQLQTLGLKFDVMPAAVDETALANEKPAQLSRRLAEAKAMKIKSQNPTACVIGSDQVCAFGQQVFGKPGTAEQATQQLQIFSNNCIEFFTALCVLNASGQPLVHVDITRVKFRELTNLEIKRYIEIEQPFDCAGSFKVESLGLSLFESVRSDDPSALMGLPLIKLCEFLRACGHPMP